MYKTEDNKIINAILYEYKTGIIIAARKVKKKYRWIPLEVEDLFNIFILQIPSLLRKYDSKFNTKLKTYILNNAFYIMANYARVHSSSKFKILNERVCITGSQLQAKKRGHSSYSVLMPAFERNTRMDFTSFDSIELKILKEYFIKELSISKISLLNKFSYNKTRRIIQIIRYKVKINNKNFIYS